MAKKMTMDDVVSSSLNFTHDVMGLLSLKKFLPEFKTSSAVWMDYDKEADVLYISFRKPQRATKTIEREDDILIRKDGNKVVGVTVLHASQR